MQRDEASVEAAWYYVERDQTKGPITEPELHALVQNGTLAWDTVIWTESLGQWMAYANVFPAGAPPPPSPSAAPPDDLESLRTPPSSASETHAICSQCGATGYKYSMKRIGGRIYCPACSGERPEPPPSLAAPRAADPHEEMRRAQEPARKRTMMVVALLIVGAIGYGIFAPRPEKQPSEFKQAQIEYGKNVGKNLYKDGQLVGQIVYLQFAQPNQNMVATGPGYFTYQVKLAVPQGQITDDYIPVDAPGIEIR